MTIASAPRPRISASTSLALDVLRIGAALTVVVFHACGQWLTAYPAAHAVLGRASHTAVVVFFVISGYVIAFTTATNNRGPRQYAAARLSRLYAVLVPSLLLTAVVEAVVGYVDPELTARYVREHSGLRYALSALFLNESGPFSAAPPLNSPLWSLSYEFWYYALFGIWFYGRRRQRAGWLIVAGIVAGPKILLLLPVWLLGVGAYYRPPAVLHVGRAWMLVGVGLGLTGLVAGYLPALPMAVGDPPLFMAGQFLTDWLVGAFCALALHALPATAWPSRPAWTKVLRLVADLSFPVYALHFPLLVLWRALLGWRPNDFVRLAQATAGVLLLATAAGFLLEKQRWQWVRLFTWASGRTGKKPPTGRRKLPAG